MNWLAYFLPIAGPPASTREKGGASPGGHERGLRSWCATTAVVGILLAPQSAVAQQFVPREDLPVQPVCLGEQAAGQPDNRLPDCLSPQAQVVAAQSESDDQDTELEPIAAGRSLQQSIERKKNITAADLQPSWNDLKSLSTRAGFRSLTTDQAKAARKAVFVWLRAAHADSEGTTTPLHTVSRLHQHIG